MCSSGGAGAGAGVDIDTTHTHTHTHTQTQTCRPEHDPRAIGRAAFFAERFASVTNPPALNTRKLNGVRGLGGWKTSGDTVGDEGTRTVATEITHSLNLSDCRRCKTKPSIHEVGVPRVRTKEQQRQKALVHVRERTMTCRCQTGRLAPQDPLHPRATSAPPLASARARDAP